MVQRLWNRAHRSVDPLLRRDYADGHSSRFSAGIPCGETSVRRMCLLVGSLSLACAAAAETSFTGGHAIDGVIQQAIHDDRMPGAVVAVGHNDEIVYQKAYGNRAVVPD